MTTTATGKTAQEALAEAGQNSTRSILEGVTGLATAGYGDRPLSSFTQAVRDDIDRQLNAAVAAALDDLKR